MDPTVLMKMLENLMPSQVHLHSLEVLLNLDLVENLFQYSLQGLCHYLVELRLYLLEVLKAFLLVVLLG